MSRVDELKLTIESLSMSERAELERLLHGWTDDAWDLQMVSDAKAGRLDDLLKQVDAEIDAGRLRDLP